MPIPRPPLTRRTLLYLSSGALAAAGATGVAYYHLNADIEYPASTAATRRPPPPWTPPTRAEMLERLRASGRGKAEHASTSPEDDVYDLLVIGGGATGAGVALDAATRGLKVALVERDDFSSGTSSKSTKLVHGGVRYLQKAILEADYQQYKLVKEALYERKIFLQTAPYLSGMLPIMLPVYKWWQIPYYLSGSKLYDLLAGKENMESSYFLSKGKALEIFPMLKREGLAGAVVYYDGQHNDSRMNTALVLTAVKHGATVLNYCEVTSLLKDSDGKLTGAMVSDNLAPPPAPVPSSWFSFSNNSDTQPSTSFAIRARGIVNATGPYTDALLTLDDPAHRPIVSASSGIHITLPGYYSPRRMGLLDPATSDGRVIFFLPWQGNTIAGTTDREVDMGSRRRAGSGAEMGGDDKMEEGDLGGRDRGVTASEEDIRWVLGEIRSYLSPDIKVRRGDVLSAWSGVRPLVKNPEANADGTAGLVRSHVIHVSPSGLLTIAGGKWTTYRRMAEETVDEAVKVFGLENKVNSGCVSHKTKLIGSDGWSRTMFIGLIQTYGLETEVARHLSDNYGDRAWTVCSLAEATGETWPLYGKRISPQYPFIEAEIRYAIRHEYAVTPVDVLARRTRLSFLNARAAFDALPRVVQIMGHELNWTAEERVRHAQRSVAFLVGSMGLVGNERVLRERIGRRVRGEVWSGAKARTCGVGLGRSLGLGWIGRTLGIGVLSAGGEREGRRVSAKGGVKRHVFGRAVFGPGELAVLRSVFVDAASTPAAPSSVGSDTDVIREDKNTSRVKKSEVLRILKQAQPAVYADVTGKDYEYVLKEAGLWAGAEQEEGGANFGLNFDEFVEVAGSLKEVGVRPDLTAEKEQRGRIPVEKSGGGV